MFKKRVLNLIILFFILILLLLDLEAKKIKILKAVASSIQDNNSEFKPENAIDNDFSTRWSSEFSDPQWICFDLGSKKSFQTVTILWESAYGKVYELQISDNALDWKTIFKENNGDGDEDEDIIITKRQKARYVRIYCIKRGTQWGYSIWDVSILSKKKELYKRLRSFQIKLESYKKE